MKIVVVDPVRADREPATNVLTAAGHDVVQAADVHTAATLMDESGVSSMSAKQRDFDSMISMLATCAEALLLSLGLRASCVPCTANDTTVGPSVLAVIGFTGDTVRGALIIQTTRAAAELLLPADLAPDSFDDLGICDAVGEQANQLLGRLKQKLLASGVTVRIATPTSATTNGLYLHVPPATHSSWLGMSTRAGPVLVRLDADFSPDFAFTHGAASNAPLVAEGEAIMF